MYGSPPFLPFYIFERPHGIGGECPAFDAFGVNFACLGLCVTVDCHYLVLGAAVLREEMASSQAKNVRANLS